MNHQQAFSVKSLIDLLTEVPAFATPSIREDLYRWDFNVEEKRRFNEENYGATQTEEAIRRIVMKAAAMDKIEALAENARVHLTNEGLARLDELLTQNQQQIQGKSGRIIYQGRKPPEMPKIDYAKMNRWAVLVGVGAYDDVNNYGALPSCVHDARSMHQTLVQAGYDPFRINLLVDDGPELPTTNLIIMAITQMAKNADPDDLILFYYSGHGDYNDDDSFLVGRDGYFNAKEDTQIPFAKIKRIVESARARAKVIILDACHAGANLHAKSGGVDSAGFIRRVYEQAEGLAIITSCERGERSYFLEDNNASVFTHYLLEGLAGQADFAGKQIVTVSDLSRYVTDRVKRWATQNQLVQRPMLINRSLGDIILADWRVGAPEA